VYGAIPQEILLCLACSYLTTTKNNMMEWMSKLAETDLKVRVNYISYIHVQTLAQSLLRILAKMAVGQGPSEPFTKDKIFS